MDLPSGVHNDNTGLNFDRDHFSSHSIEGPSDKKKVFVKSQSKDDDADMYTRSQEKQNVIPNLAFPDDFCEEERKYLLRYTTSLETKDFPELEKLSSIFKLVDEALSNQSNHISSSSESKTKSLQLLATSDPLPMWNQYYDKDDIVDQHNDSISKEKVQIKSSNTKKFQSLVEEHLQGFAKHEKEGLDDGDPVKKRRYCRHFLKGHCKRGTACDFLHDASIFCSDMQKVFLGGLPPHVTEAILLHELTKLGHTVINKPKVLRGFTPQVCMGSVEEAQKLIDRGKIMIDGSSVDVRPYEAFAKDYVSEKIPFDSKRSVFLGGLSSGTTGQMIRNKLELMDLNVVNHPLIKNGFAPQVTLGTVEQAKKLLKLKQLQINDRMVDIRPYFNRREPLMHERRS